MQGSINSICSGAIVSTADLAHTGTLNIDVLTPGASLTYLSGSNYSLERQRRP